jgi:membrane protein implicated in regulation of membrane protease activity
MLTRRKKILIAIPTISIVFGGFALASLNLSKNQFVLFLFTFIAVVSILEIIAIRIDEKSIGVSEKDVSFELINKSGKVLQDCTSKSGKVIIGGEIWNAMSAEHQTILAGTEIEVINRQGLTLSVKPKKDIIEA